MNYWIWICSFAQRTFNTIFMKNITNPNDLQRIDSLYDKISNLIDQARNNVSKSINTIETYCKYGIGKYIIENELDGKYRASYGKKALKILSDKLTDKYGNGWSVETLTLCRKFYSVYSKIVNGVYEISDSHIDDSTYPNFNLSWSHYLILMRIENHEERHFYEIETLNQNWSVRQLQRQVSSSLFERLALSRNRNEVIRLANEGQTIEKPTDILKNPLTLEFLGLKPETSYSENKLEEVIINKLQMFLLELGKGFLFESRQKRFTFDEDNFYVDLVLYNRLLQCYVLIDLKTDKLSHQDLGQMQMYVNYFDRYVKKDYEKPTIGILLCKTKSDSLVELTLPKEANIYAQEYALCLPDKKLLKEKLKEWTSEYEDYKCFDIKNTK